MNHTEPHRHRHSGQALIKLAFNCSMKDRYTYLRNFEMEVINVLETKAYVLLEEERVPVLKNGLGQKGLLLIQMFTQEEKE